jgi:hypothetical protein
MTHIYESTYKSRVPHPSFFEGWDSTVAGGHINVGSITRVVLEH